MLSVKLVGPTPFAVRFWPAFFGILSSLGVYRISWLLFGNKRVSFLSGLILCTSFIYVGMSKAALTDVVFTFWVTAAFCCFYWGYSDRRYKNAGIILFFVFIAFGVLTKGLLGIGLPLMGVHLYLRYKKDLGFFNCRAALWGLGLFLAIAGPWHILMYKWYGKPFIDEYWYNVHVRRLFEAEHKKSSTWYFYPTVMLGGMMPWTFFLIPALFLFGQKIKNQEAKDRQPFIFILAWWAGTLIVPQIAKSKLASYILPAFPPLIVAVAYYLNSVFEKKEGWRGLQIGGVLLAMLIVGIAIGLLMFAHHHAEYVTTSDMNHFYFFSFLLMICALTILTSALQKRMQGMLAGTVGIIVAALLAVGLIYRSAEPWVSCQQVSEALQKIDSSNAPLLASKFFVRGMHFYTKRPIAVFSLGGDRFFSPHPIPFFDHPKDLREFLEQRPVTYGVLTKNTIEEIESIQIAPYGMVKIQQIGNKHLVKFERQAQ
jgi:4-amino-4-deoxy-L-arabinose transferase-like glycosyltransferase